MKSKLLKKKIGRVFILLGSIITASFLLIGGTYALENDFRWLGYCFVILSLYIVLIANGFVVVEEIRDLLETLTIIAENNKPEQKQNIEDH